MAFLGFYALSAAGPCREASEIISNNMLLAAGSGDTLWVASFSQQREWGVNSTTTQGDQWRGYYLGCLEADVFDIALGSGVFAALLNPSDYDINRLKPSTVWYYSHRDGKVSTVTIKWPDTLFKADTLAAMQAIDMVAADGLFFLAFQNGGLIRWNPSTNSVSGFLPGGTGSFDPATFDYQRFPTFGSATELTRVISVDRRATASGTSVAVATPPRVWLFNPADSSWDSSVTTTLADTALGFAGIVSVFVNNCVAPSILYAYINTKSGSADKLLSLFRYADAPGQWVRVLKEAPRAIAPASQGYLYCVTGENQITVYRDSVGDTVSLPPSGLTAAISDEAMYKRIIGSKGIDKPQQVNDLLFIPLSDTSGHLCIVSSEGMFLSYGEVPGVSTAEFKLLRRDRTIKSGLKETYAKPGIITDDYRNPNAGKTTFMYKLGKDAKVTIRIYDYAMQQVKTIIDNAPRKTATLSGRSTDGREDVWDGTTRSGRPVAPGVYYYKITTSTGERSFGKIIVAKGAGY